MEVHVKLNASLNINIRLLIQLEEIFSCYRHFVIHLLVGAENPLCGTEETHTQQQ